MIESPNPSFSIGKETSGGDTLNVSKNLIDLEAKLHAENEVYFNEKGAESDKSDLTPQDIGRAFLNFANDKLKNRFRRWGI